MKKSVMLLIVLLVLSSFTLAQSSDNDNDCAGFFGSIKCFLFGDASKRAVAGSAWYENE